MKTYVLTLLALCLASLSLVACGGGGGGSHHHGPRTADEFMDQFCSGSIALELTELTQNCRLRMLPAVLTQSGGTWSGTANYNFMDGNQTNAAISCTKVDDVNVSIEFAKTSGDTPLLVGAAWAQTVSGESSAVEARLKEMTGTPGGKVLINLQNRTWSGQFAGEYKTSPTGGWSLYTPASCSGSFTMPNP